MKLTDFDSFFHQLNGFWPFAWQWRTLEHLAATGVWPEEVCAPTGTGKSALVDIHIFAVALHALGEAPRVPRRLATVVNRRALVDASYDRAERIGRQLTNSTGGVLAKTRDALKSLTPVLDTNGTNATPKPLVCINLRGGVPIDRDWLTDPRACAVIAATPDMVGSRLLMRGYGSSRLARPREAGLLALDTVMVVDEAHLSRQLERTVRQVSAYTQPGADALGVPALQCVSTTATPAIGGSGIMSMGVTAADIASDDALRRRLHTPKPVTYVGSPVAPKGGKATPKYLNMLTDQVWQLSERVRDAAGAWHTVACVVNTVATAVAVRDRLAKRCTKEDPAAQVALWVGRMRQVELDRSRKEFPKLFRPTGDPRVRFVVATQTVEVGVDMNWAGLVTELCPPAALAQRAGRVNRLGGFDSGPIVVVGPEQMPDKDALPYAQTDLADGYRWVHQLAETDTGCAAATWLTDPTLAPPAAQLQRLAFSDLTPADLPLLAHTSTDMFAELDLSFWLRDNLKQDDQQVGFCLRGPLPDDGSARALVEATPPAEHEIFPASMAVAQTVLKRLLKPDGTAEAQPRWVWRHGAMMDIPPQADSFQALPGDVIVMPHDALIASAGVVVEDEANVELHQAFWGEDGVRVVLSATSSLEEPDEADTSNDACSDQELMSAVANADSAELHAVVSDLVGYSVQVEVGPMVDPDAAESVPAWLILSPVATVAASVSDRQMWTPARTPVPLEQHSQAVADRARLFAEQLGLTAQVQEALGQAGWYHDVGKADGRFQRGVLGNTSDQLWAKSARSPQALRRNVLDAVPPRWRHEQLSAAVAACELSAPGRVTAEDCRRVWLVVRLVGTSHGHGRPFFPHGAASLTGTPDSAGEASQREVIEAANRLYAPGTEWHRIVEETHNHWGYWGCAYLEAVLRSADGQVSAEGS